MLFQLCLTKMLTINLIQMDTKMSTIFNCRDYPKIIVIDVFAKRLIKKHVCCICAKSDNWVCSTFRADLLIEVKQTNAETSLKPFLQKKSVTVEAA